MKKIFLLATPLLLLFISCQKTDYETVVKDDDFRSTISSGNFVELSNGYTYYELANDNKEKTLVFIHGFSVPSYIWDETFNAAKNKGYRVIRLDLFGRGYSNNPNIDYTDDLFANQVIELLNYLKIKKATFLGLSNGGRVISKLASIKPNLVEKLIYVSASSFYDNPSISSNIVTDKEVQDFITSNYPTISKGQLLDFKYPENYPSWEGKYEELLSYKGFARALISTRKNHVNLNKENLLISEINLPIYTIWGDSDLAVVYNDFKENLNKVFPNRFEYFVPNSGHLPNIENKSNFENYLFNVVLKTIN
jgi:pimeloyl-ACP methyl ester carboxylesterase|tara:strand:+ start:2040 stop:2963 length:924 start_codon:yes stop_codon:yes gene_type:complete